MKLIIDIPEDVYTRLFDNGIQDNEIAVDDVCEMARALRLGTPLPKGHGISLNEWHEQAKDVKYSANNSTTIRVKPQDRAISLNAVLEIVNNPLNIRVEEIIKQLPPVKPQPKTGHWIWLDECSNSGYYCSECHKKVVKEGWSNTVKKIKYCPNCGAKMIER